MSAKIPKNWTEGNHTKTHKRFHTPEIVELVKQKELADDGLNDIRQNLFKRTLEKLDLHFKSKKERKKKKT